MFKLLKYLWAYAPRGKYMLVFLAIAAGVSRDLVMLVINQAAAAVNTDAWLSVWLPVFVLVLLGFLLSGYVYRVASESFVTQLVKVIRLDLTQNLFKVKPGFLSERGHGALYQIMTQDVTTVSRFSARLLEMLPAVIFLSIAIPQVFMLSIAAGLLVICVMIGGIAAYDIQRRALMKEVENIRTLEIAYFDRVYDTINGFRELRLNENRRDDLYEHIAQIVDDHRDAQILVQKKYGLGDMAVQALKFGLFGGILFLVPFLAAQDATTVFQLLTIVLFSLMPFEGLVSKYPQFIAAGVCFGRVDELNQALAKYLPDSLTTDAPAGPFETVEMRNAVAVHRGREQSGFQLGPLDFTLNRGEVVFVVGGNGSGKTTFFHVLAGLMDPIKGELLVDGEPVPREQMETYRSRFSAVFIDYYLFRKLYGLYEAPEKLSDDVISEVGLAGLTEIAGGEFKRVDLSAGQRRRLALAVAMLEDRQILILDEFVADQDPQKRKYFFEVLLPKLKAAGKTVLVATHDLSRVNMCDRLVRFDKGRIESIRKFVDGEEVREGGDAGAEPGQPALTDA